MNTPCIFLFSLLTIKWNDPLSIIQVATHFTAALIGGYQLANHFIFKRHQTIGIENVLKIAYINMGMLVCMTVYTAIDSYKTLSDINEGVDFTKEKSSTLLTELSTSNQELKLELKNTQNALKNIEDKIQKMCLGLNIADDDKDLFTKGTDKIYDEVFKEFIKRTDYSKRTTISILGYTLFSVSPKIPVWEREGFLRNITINLYHLDTAYISHTRYLDHSWGASVVGNIIKIKSFMKLKNLAKQGVIINFYPYDHIPGVHGFKFDNGPYFVGVANFENGKTIEQPNDGLYFNIFNENHTNQANEYRRIFDSWLEVAGNDSKRLSDALKSPKPKKRKTNILKQKK